MLLEQRKEIDADRWSLEGGGTVGMLRKARVASTCVLGSNIVVPQHLRNLRTEHVTSPFPSRSRCSV
jgi:hypothetical protein